MVDQAREIERLENKLKVKDQALCRSEDEVQSLKRQMGQFQDQMNRTLQYIRNENTPSSHFSNDEDLVEKVLILENFIRDQTFNNSKVSSSKYEYSRSKEFKW